MARRSRPHWRVKPRYTPGSPATFYDDEATALLVAKQERRCYPNALAGIYGEELRRVAERDGLAGIVEERFEVVGKKGWRVTDLLTGEKFFRRYDGEVLSWR